jgi:DNA topoisomerase IA
MKPGMKLIIVESATKANTIKRFLTSGEGKGEWEVDYCMGHVRELPRTAADMPPTAKKEKSKVRVCVCVCMYIYVCVSSELFVMMVVVMQMEA